MKLLNILFSLITIFNAVQFVDAQYPPRIVDLYEIESPVNPKIKIRFKSPDSQICNTTNTSQKQYTGHIHLPPGTIDSDSQEYPINTFFWFFEARENPQDAPLTIWLNGGPGSSSMIGNFQEIGPCEVVEADRTNLKTVPREYGWDRISNLLFIDQPNQVGFSYDVPTNGVLPLLQANNHYIPGVAAPHDGGGHVLADIRNPNSIKYATEHTNLLNGTFSSGDMRHTANTTAIAAHATWHFLQSWVTNFPQYYPNNTALNFVAESYGGHYGPEFSAFIEEQNDRIAAGELPPGTKELHLSSLGIINGCIDALLQGPYYAIYGNNNPYNITAVSRNAANRAIHNFFKPGGCRDRILKCRRLRKAEDPYDAGDNQLVNLTCRDADDYCDKTQMNIYFAAHRGVYDITHAEPDPFPPDYFLEYLNNATVQQAIGSPVNFTKSNTYVYKAFGSTGDMPRDGEIDDIGYLLDKGVRVALIYGDRDYICNYMGGEAVSLAVNYTYAQDFAAAGYEYVRVNSSFIGGQVRQHGNFSFTRVFQAGHLVPAYQPETAFTIFERLIFGKSIANGEEISTTGDDIYSSTGPNHSTVGFIPSPPPPPLCFVRAISSCTKEQIAMLAAGKGIVINGVLYNSTGEYHMLQDRDRGPQKSTNIEETFGNTEDPSSGEEKSAIPDNIDPEKNSEKEESPEDAKDKKDDDPGEGRRET